METEELRELSKYVSGIAIPILISASITKLLYAPSVVLIDIVIVISIICFIGSSITYVFSKFISRFFWRFSHKRRLQNSIVGIIREEELNPEKSRFSPEFWKNLVEDKYQTRYISVIDGNQICNDFVAIINPYGECYPEVDIGEKTTFKKIKEYVKNGGIFVSTCGCAFWYAWNKEVGQIPTAGEIYGLRGKNYPNQVSIKNIPHEGHIEHVPITYYDVVLQEPTYGLEPLQSLSDTLSFHELKLLTTAGPPRLVKLTQKNDEIERFGYIPRFGLDRYIFEFRATRKPSQNFKPIVRARLHNPGNPKKPIDIFPLAYVPHGKGKFLFTGMHMDLRCSEDDIVLLTDENEVFPIIWTNIYKKLTDKIIENQPKMVYIALDKLIEEQKNDYLNRNTNQTNRNRNNPQDDRTNILNCRI